MKCSLEGEIMNLLKKIIPKVLKVKIRKLISSPSYNATKKYVVNISENNKKFDGEIAIVTGGSGAIGRAICLRLSLEGAIVFVAGRNEANVESVVSEISEIGGVAFPLIMDITNAYSIEDSINQVVAKYGQVDILVNCAGGSTRGLNANLHEQSVEVIDDMLNTNLRGSMLCSRQVGKQMVLQKNGKIINVASVIGLMGKAKFTDYAAAKAGVIGYTKSLALELGHYGITVNCVSPGLIQRGVFDEKKADKLKKSNYLGKVGSLEDIANSVVFIASKEADFITGQNIVVDGGRMLGLHGDD